MGKHKSILLVIRPEIWPRTNAELLEKVSKESYGEGYRTIVFDAALGTNRQPIYHTNVMMWIGSKVAAVSLECISNLKVR